MLKHFRYLGYIVRHKWFVFLAGLRVGGVPIWRLVIHDWSKFMPCEWFPYARFFYGYLIDWNEAKIECPSYPWEKTKQGVAEAFDRAWLHHQHFNPHHWQHWILREDSGVVKLLEMPDHFRCEMVADWMGAGRAITGKWETVQWYEKNCENIQLAPETRRHVEAMLKVSMPKVCAA